ncbi:MAG: hypothetical protein WBR15_06335 [Gammaproteobacteria bacterium]
MRSIATSIAALIVFWTIWIVIAQFDPKLWRAAIYALELTTVVILIGMHYWQAGNILDSIEIQQILVWFLILALALLLLVAHLVVMHVNPLTPSHWFKMPSADNQLRSLLTIAVNISFQWLFLIPIIYIVFIAPLMLATVIRASILYTFRKVAL